MERNLRTIIRTCWNWPDHTLLEEVAGTHLYWQASGESIKTSVRTKTRMEQLTQEGYFTGGGVPFGYRLEHQGRTNERMPTFYHRPLPLV